MRGEAAGEWTGSGAQALGLDGAATGGQLRALLEGRDPATGEVLRSRAVHVTGWDVTYSPPKSVSVLHAAGDPRIAAETLAAHRAAVRSALGYLESEACWTRRGAGGTTRLVGEGFVGGRVRASGQPRRGCAAAFPCGHRQHDPRRWALDHAGRPGALRASEDRVGAVSRRAAGRADAAAGGRVGAGGAGQAGGRDQGRAAGGLARSEPSAPGDRAAHGRTAASPARARPRPPRWIRARPRTTTSIGATSPSSCARGSPTKGLGPAELADVVDRQRPERPTKDELVRISRELLGPARDDRAPVHVLAPRRHPAVGQRPPPGRVGRADRAAHRPLAGPAGDRRARTRLGHAGRLGRPAAADAARPPRRAAVLDPDAARHRAGPARDGGQAPSRGRGRRSERRPSCGRSPRTRR